MTYPATLSLPKTDKKICADIVSQTLAEHKIVLNIILTCPKCLQNFKNQLKENGKISDLPDRRSQVELSGLRYENTGHTTR